MTNYLFDKLQLVNFLHGSFKFLSLFLFLMWSLIVFDTVSSVIGYLGYYDLSLAYEHEHTYHTDSKKVPKMTTFRECQIISYTYAEWFYRFSPVLVR